MILSPHQSEGEDGGGSELGRSWPDMKIMIELKYALRLGSNGHFSCVSLWHELSMP